MTRPWGVLNLGPPALQADALTNTPWRHICDIFVYNYVQLSIFSVKMPALKAIFGIIQA